MKSLVRLSLVLTLVSVAAGVSADEVQVAVAANFTAPMKQIAAAFEKETGHVVNASFASTGKLYAQIKNGAPFEALLAADDKTPTKIEEEGLGVVGTRFTYAVGTLVLWSADPHLIDDQGKMLAQGDFTKLAIANPKLAPYGAAAIETLKALGLLEPLESKFVEGENIAQAYQFVRTGNAALGFVALSQVMKGGELSEGSAWIVPGKLHAPIRQDAIILKPGDGKPAVIEFMDYLKGDKAREIIRAFGYEI